VYQGSISAEILFQGCTAVVWVVSGDPFMQPH